MTHALGASIAELPGALDREAEIAARLARGRAFVFLDYDGTLTPIVDDPDDAVLSDSTRAAIARLGALCAVAVVSGRDLDDVRGKVGLDGIHYAGSHGFDILTADGERHRRGDEYRPALERAADAVEESLGEVAGAAVERKRFAVAVHFRALENPADERRVEEAVDRALTREEGLRKTGGKKIFELRPDIEWDKGRAVLLLLEVLDPDPDRDGEASEWGRVPLYIGDDDTDEDAFLALPDAGIGIVVEGEVERRTAAEYALPSAASVRDFLSGLADLLEGSGATASASS